VTSTRRGTAGGSTVGGTVNGGSGSAISVLAMAGSTNGGSADQLREGSGAGSSGEMGRLSFSLTGDVVTATGSAFFATAFGAGARTDLASRFFKACSIRAMRFT
jgi:hypothetical protein